MKFEKISYNQIKVTVSLEDLSALGVSMDNLNSREAQELFWNLIRRAEHETGFVVDDARIVIEAMPLKNEGIVMFVTRIDDDDDDFEFFQKFRTKSKRARYRVKKVPAPKVSEVFIYRFDSFDDLCQLVAATSVDFESKLYLYEDRYYLLLVLDEMKERTARFCEYAVRISNAEMSKAFLEEHGTLICENAVETVRKYFVR